MNNDKGVHSEVSQKSLTSQENSNLLQRIIGSSLKFFANIFSTVFKTALTIFLLFFFIGGFGSVFSGTIGETPLREVHLTGEGEDKIVIVPLRGIILNQVDPFSGNTEVITPDSVARTLRRLGNDSHVRGVILDIDSPGGSAVASDRIFESIRAYKQQTKRPVVTLMGDVTASGGYYISAATDKIVANPATITGSIGVIATNFKVMNLLDKLGIKEEVYKKGLYKDILSQTRETTDEEKKIIDSMLDDPYTLFIDRIVEGRKMERSKVQSLATGRIYSGREAKTVGLVDELGNMEKAVEVSKALSGVSRVQIVRIETTNFFSQLFSGFSLGSLLPFLRPASLPKIWFLMQ